MAVFNSSILSLIEPDRSARKMISLGDFGATTLGVNMSRILTETINADWLGTLGCGSAMAREANKVPPRDWIRRTKSFPRQALRSDSVALAFLGSKVGDSWYLARSLMFLVVVWP